MSLRPTWLSSETRFLSDQPPVLTPAERAAQNGSGGLESAGTDRHTAAAIDRAAEAGAVKAPEEHPPTQIIETPGSDPVDPGTEQH